MHQNQPVKQPEKNMHPLTNSGSDSSRGIFDRAPVLSNADKAALKKHVVNLNNGRFSDDGFTTSPFEVRAIFEQHIPDWVDTLPDDGQPIRIVFYAHGGLTNEGWGLHTANVQRPWWLAKNNHVYPIFFVWETGALEILWNMFSGSRDLVPEMGARGVVSDWFSELEDKTWEVTARAIGVPKLWSGMKESARLTFLDTGDGNIVLETIKKFAQQMDKKGSPFELHAVGHSAGSIFLTYMLEAAAEMKLPGFESLHFLAPAITNELFLSKTKPLIGNRTGDTVGSLAMYTMTDDLERDDDTTQPYNKSLLYLVQRALESKKNTPILGMETSIYGDPDIAKFFGLGGNRNNSRTDLILSSTAGDDSVQLDSRSESISHGGFDNDPATMNSVLRRILKAGDRTAITSFPTGTRSPAAGYRMPPLRSAAPTKGFQAAVPSTPGPQTKDSSAATPSGNRKALCIGINEYPQSPLAGCVQDSHDWEQLFGSVGFEVTTLRDQQATRSAIFQSISTLLDSANPGDTVVIQYAGHGTKVPIVGPAKPDEVGDTPEHDEALVPIDYLDNGLVLDDDIGELCNRNIKDGVSVNFVMDCCHSGSITRMFLNKPNLDPNGQSRSRYLPATPELLAAHRRSLQQQSNLRSLNSAPNPYRGRKEILFAACRSSEVAWETGGHGDFTLAAIAILKEHPNLTAEQFIFKVIQAFGATARQTPGLWCDPSLRATPLLGGAFVKNV